MPVYISSIWEVLLHRARGPHRVSLVAPPKPPMNSLVFSSAVYRTLTLAHLEGVSDRGLPLFVL